MTPTLRAGLLGWSLAAALFAGEPQKGATPVGKPVRDSSREKPATASPIDAALAS